MAVGTVPASRAATAERVYPSALVADGSQVLVATAAPAPSACSTSIRPDPSCDRAPRSAATDPARDLVVTCSHLWVTNQTDDRVLAIARDSVDDPRVELEIPTPTLACIVVLPVGAAAIA